jgi:alkylation response protein AidB-like acyl-CoA dehydrogenase
VTARERLDPGQLPGEEEREMLRASVRGYLQAHWVPVGAVERAADAPAVSALWAGMVDQGLTALGSQAEDGGLREWVVVFEELGRAAAPLPMLGAALANLALSPDSAFALRAPAPACDPSPRPPADGIPAPSTSSPAAGSTHAADPAARRLLDRLHRGEARLALSFGELDPDPRVASLEREGEALDGTLRHVDAAAQATDLLVFTPDGLARVDLAAPGVTVTPTRALGADGWCEVALRAVPCETLAVEGEALEDLRLVARLLLLARAHGAARRAFELAVEHAKQRRQFGQPIGRFQAIQHKLADNLIALEGVRLTGAGSAEGLDLGDAAWRYHTQAALGFGPAALRQATLQTHHAFGAIGYAEEHEAPRHFRRVHLDTLLLGSAREARGALAVCLLDDDAGSPGDDGASDAARVPEVDLGPAGNAFRDEVRAWLREHWSGARKAAHDARPFHEREWDPSFALDLGRTGWLGLAWPREFGGQARSPLEQLAFIEVMERAEAPRIGASVQASALIMHGTPEQQARYLPEILRGEVMHGMGYSEPDAGSDLASLRTRAVWEDGPTGPRWRINGQKIWTTTYWGRYMFLAARTDRDAQPPQAGISMFIVPMDTPGITVKPARTLYDGTFANIFYDDVRIPASNLVGPLHGGWKVLTDALANERGLVGGGVVLKVLHGFERLCRELRRSPALRDDPLVRDRIGQLAAEIEVGRRLMLHCAERAVDGTTPPDVGAISKVWSGELMERYGEAALDLLGAAAALSQGASGAIDNGRFEQQLRHSLMWVISIGTNEIQRSLIAQRGLGLPR